MYPFWYYPKNCQRSHSSTEFTINSIVRSSSQQGIGKRIPLNEKVVGLVAMDSLAANCFGEAAMAKA